MKKFLKLSLCVLLLLFAVWKIEAVCYYISGARGFVRHCWHILKTHYPAHDLSNLPQLTDNGGEWYAKYHFIAHNGGIIEGRLHTGSKEAWEHSYERGVRIIDADYELTSDNHGVIRHGWAETLEQGQEPNPMTLHDFMSAPINYKYHAISAEDIIDFMRSHSDVYIAVDAKHDPVKIFGMMVQDAKRMNAEEILSRVIVSVYDTRDIGRVKAVYPFKNFALRQYGFSHNWYALAEFCVKNDIHAVNIFNFVIDKDPDGVKILTSKGIHVFAAVVNSLSQLQAYKDLGVTGAVSDFLSESDWELLR